MIDINNVTKRYPVPKRYKEYLFHPFRKQTITALTDINLAMNRGDAVGLLGPNGAGKTTLLKLIAGLLYPSLGSIIVGDYDTQKHNSLARKNVGYVLNEERSFYWRLTGMQNLEFFGVLNNLSGKTLRKKIRELLNMVGLKSAGNRRVSNYSSGMRQRLAVARGLLADPEVLILDEPTKALDPLGAENLRNIIAKSIRYEQKKTLIIATHQLEEAKMLCNKIGIITNGRLTELAPINEISNMTGGLKEYYKSAIHQSEVTQC